MIVKLMKGVFGYRQGEKVAILYDIMEDKDEDWKFRKRLAEEWKTQLEEKGVDVELIAFPATGSNNADLPEDIVSKIIGKDIVIAPTRYSATAPLSRLAKEHGFRGATMPGFDESMMAALELDYNDVSEKVAKIHDIFSDADSAEIIFRRAGKEYRLFVDLRHRRPLKDDGFCKEKGRIINLPSGEAFIAPNDEEDSRTEGFLPVGDAVYQVSKNNIAGSNKPTELMERIRKDPAVGNIAELAFGVLGLYGIKGCGKILLDEKLGMHIALGRSDHFGGKTGVSSFKNEKNVWHQDYVYTEDMQPGIDVIEAKVGSTIIIKNNKYTIF